MDGTLTPQGQVELIDALRAFNRKERFLLVGWALDNPSFTLGYEFRRALEAATGIAIPPDAFVAMDYHINWLYAALLWGTGQLNLPAPRASEVDGPMRGNIEDLDLVVAFAASDHHQVLLIEAKGYTPWDPRQLEHKADRLKTMRELVGEDQPIEFSFVTAGPSRPPGGNWTALLSGAGYKVDHLEMPAPAQHKVAVIRVDESGKPDRDGGHWSVVRKVWPVGPPAPIAIADDAPVD